MDRKEFFSYAWKLAVKKGCEVLEPLEESETSTRQKQRPPGASASEKEFLRLCSGCDACMAACPANVVYIEDLKTRDPVIYSDKEPCICCPGYPCIASCPTGALSKDNALKPRDVTKS